MFSSSSSNFVELSVALFCGSTYFRFAGILTSSTALSWPTRMARSQRLTVSSLVLAPVSPRPFSSSLHLKVLRSEAVSLETFVSHLCFIAVLKTRLQQQKGTDKSKLKYKGPIHAAQTIIKEEGVTVTRALLCSIFWLVN